MANIGEIVRFKIVDTAGREFACEGMVYGRVKDRGGKKYLIKTWSIVDAPIIGIRKVKKICKK